MTSRYEDMTGTTAREGRRFDLIVVGGGSGGYAAARTAADAGVRVAIVDQGPLGGLCILRGCMPSKTLLASADVAARMRRAKEFGFAPVEVQADLGTIVDRKQRLVREFAEDRIQALRDARFTLFEGRAAFRSPHEIQVGAQVLTGASIVIATGSTVPSMPIPGLAEAGYETSDTIMDLRRQPDSLVVLGGGSVGTELGQFFARIGTHVTIVQRSPTLLSYHDPEIGQTLADAFRQEGIEVWTQAEVTRVTTVGAKKTIHVRQEGRDRTVSADMILHALGRVPNLEGLNLAAAGVEVHGGKPVLGADLRTSQPHIFVVGDANGLTPIVHLAIQQGELAAYNALHPSALQRRVDHRLDMDVVFTDPEVAVLGLEEAGCRAQGVGYLTASYPFADHGKAMCLGVARGS